MATRRTRVRSDDGGFTGWWQAQIDESVPGAELSISGPLNVHTVSEVRSALSRAIDGGIGDLLLHLGTADIGDATGLGVLVGAHHRAERAGRRLVLADVSPRIERLLRGSRLDRVLTRTA